MYYYQSFATVLPDFDFSACMRCNTSFSFCSIIFKRSSASFWFIFDCCWFCFFCSCCFFFLGSSSFLGGGCFFFNSKRAFCRFSLASVSEGLNVKRPYTLLCWLLIFPGGSIPLLYYNTIFPVTPGVARRW